MSQSAENLRGGTLLCVINFGYRRSLDERVGDGEHQDFPSKIFCLTVSKNSVGQPGIVSLISGIEKFFASEVMSRFSVENNLSHSAEKFRRGSLLCCASENYR